MHVHYCTSYIRRLTPSLSLQNNSYLSLSLSLSPTGIRNQPSSPPLRLSRGKTGGEGFAPGRKIGRLVLAEHRGIGCVWRIRRRGGGGGVLAASSPLVTRAGQRPSPPPGKKSERQCFAVGNSKVATKKDAEKPGNVSDKDFSTEVSKKSPAPRKRNRCAWIF